MSQLSVAIQAQLHYFFDPRLPQNFVLKLLRSGKSLLLLILTILSFTRGDILDVGNLFSQQVTTLVLHLLELT